MNQLAREKKQPVTKKIVFNLSSGTFRSRSRSNKTIVGIALHSQLYEKRSNTLKERSHYSSSFSSS